MVMSQRSILSQRLRKNWSRGIQNPCRRSPWLDLCTKSRTTVHLRNLPKRWQDGYSPRHHPLVQRSTRNPTPRQTSWRQWAEANLGSTLYDRSSSAARLPYAARQTSCVSLCRAWLIPVASCTREIGRSNFAGDSVNYQAQISTHDVSQSILLHRKCKLLGRQGLM
jgi:hypothetical protein